METKITNDRVLSYKEWALNIFLVGLPLVGLILLFVWAFGGDTENVHRKGWAKGMLLIFLIVMIVLILFLILGGASLFAIAATATGNH